MKNNKVFTENMSTLKQFVPIVDRVHGGNHPEFHEVKADFEKLIGYVEQDDKEKAGEVFENLRKVTENYTVPGDVCESYAKVYELLSQLDSEYTNNR